MPGTYTPIRTKAAPAFAAYKLSEKSQLILALLSEGLTEEAILGAEPRITRRDLADAAREALHLNNVVRSKNRRTSKILRQYPRAYEKWCPQEEKRIAELYHAGKTLREIAAVVGRQPASIRKRLERLGAFRC